MRMRTVYPKRSNEVLLNPGKGYVLYTHFDGQVPKEYEIFGQEEFKEYERLLEEGIHLSSCFYLKLGWKQLQPDGEDRYNWEPIDRTLALAEKYDKKVVLGFGTILITGSGRAEPGKPFSLVPDWVYEAGAKYVDLAVPNYQLGGTEIDRIPVWEDPIFREKNEKLVAAVAERYDGHPRIAFVVNHNHGNYGEWHHLDINLRPMLKDYRYIDYTGRELNLDFYKYYVDLYPKYFKKSRLIMPINAIDKEDTLEPWAKYAADTYGYGFKKESLISAPDSTWTMDYCAGKGPAFAEWQTAYGQYMAEGRWDDEILDRSFIYGKLTHYNLGYYGAQAWRYIAEKKEQIHYWANHMGYYYSVASCIYKEGGAEIAIRNDGVTATYLHPEAELAIFQNGKKGKSFSCPEIDLREIGEKEEKTFFVRFPEDCPEGAVVLGIRFFADGEELLLANEKRADGYYLLEDDGEVCVHFDHCLRQTERPHENYRFGGMYMEIDFGDQRLYTNLRREMYTTCMYARVFRPEYTIQITIPAGKTLKSVSAFGYGNITLTDVSGQQVTFRLTREPKEYRTGFTGESGRVSILMQTPYACWDIQFTGFVYG